MSFYPLPLDGMPRNLRVQLYPQVLINHGLAAALTFLARLPPIRFPVLEPLRHAAHYIFRIGGNRNDTSLPKRSEPFDYGSKFHTVVSCVFFTTKNLARVVAKA